MNRVRLSIKRGLAAIALLSAELIVVIILFIAALIVFSIFAIRIFGIKDETNDLIVFDRLSEWVTPFTTSFLQGITFLGSHTFLIPANLLLAFYFLFIKKHRWYSIKVPVVALGGLLLMTLLKQFFNRPRPLVPLLEPVRGLSFPSGHALMSVSFYGLLIYLVWENVKEPIRKWLLISSLVILIILIGFSRIYLRLHYFSDVIAGFSIGVIWLSVSIWTIRRIEQYSRRKIDPVLVKSEQQPEVRP
jgi:Membrane-associated phospholipid phosphatase